MTRRKREIIKRQTKRAREKKRERERPEEISKYKYVLSMLDYSNIITVFVREEIRIFPMNRPLIAYDNHLICGLPNQCE